MSVVRLDTHRVEKPWGRRVLGSGFPGASPSENPIGEIWFGAPGEYDDELLVKYLFTSERLSVQVHPNDRQARSAGLTRGKDECWLILDAEPGARIALGPRVPITSDRLVDGIADGSIEHLLHWEPVRPGDFIFVPAGTVHSIGAGISLIEVQQNSDTTYRLYDYGRPRALHIEAGLAVASRRPFVRIVGPGAVAAGRMILVEGPSFVLERWTGTIAETAIRADRPALLIPLRGTGDIDALRWAPGECIRVHGSARIRASSTVDVLLAYPGDARLDIVGATGACSLT